MFVLGTAGHIDHGKSALVKALTGIDPDRLPEEKERGLTIDLGFAWLTLPDGGEVGLVDVPGHERFVRNMVAGAGGINAAMLVVAADDGWMPQTQEHFDILRLLDIKHGLIVVTKIDLVEKDWLELVMADIPSKVQGSFLEGAPIVQASSVTGEGIDAVAGAIAEISRRLKAIADIGKPRLFVDRAFVLTGIGVVVTGTSRDGGFAVDSEVYHFPSGDTIKVRALQSHARKAEQVGPGTRVAMNLGGVDREDIGRGHVITGFPYDLRPTIFATSIANLAGSDVALKEGRKILIILGTTETEAVIRPFPDTGIKPGNSGLAIIRTDQPVAAFVGDNFIVRLPTPQVTVGGGRILDILSVYPRRKDLPALADYLSRRSKGDLDEIIRTELARRLFTPTANFLLYSHFSAGEVDAAIERLAAGGEAARFEGNLVLTSRVSEWQTKIIRELDKTHKEKSYLKGLTAEELGRRLKWSDADQFQMLLKYYEQTNALSRVKQFYSLPGFSPMLDQKMKDQAERIMADVEKAGHNYLSLEEIDAKYPGSRQTLSFLLDEGRLKNVAGQFVIPGTIWREILTYIADRLNAQNQVTVAEFRDRFGSSRKFALPVLEYLDRLGITRREGDYRVKGGFFNERHSL